MNPNPKITIIGAGLVGCYLAGRLIQGGSKVCLVGRERIQKDIQKNGLTLSTLAGEKLSLPSEKVDYRTDYSSISESQYVIILVKSVQTKEVAQSIKPLLSKDAVVVTLQNGISNKGILQEILPLHTVISGLVVFNCIEKSPANFHKSTEGYFSLQEDSSGLEKPIVEAINRGGEEAKVHRDEKSVVWGKLNFLNGEIIALGKKHNLPTPVNQKILDLVKMAEENGQGSPKYTGKELCSKLGI
ncbi:MAG: hypothetical protein C4K58_04735 [Flavobacteriaceae bacterium]|nr:MAG: hypothetical protein C4K58_04735 [Flavobacteriaceae bacterium]